MFGYNNYITYFRIGGNMEDQIKRIRRIMANSSMTNCDNCKGSYMAFKPEFENDYCPLCLTKFVDEFIPTEESEIITEDEIKGLI